MSRRTKITVNCVADQHVRKDRERIIEFSDSETDAGGLISFFRRDDGSLLVSVYRCDPNVIVAGATGPFTIAPRPT